MTTIQINTQKKEGFFKLLASNALTFGTLSLSFFFNYKFIGGNDLLDVIIFCVFLFILIDRAKEALNSTLKIYRNVSSEKINRIEKILSSK